MREKVKKRTMTSLQIAEITGKTHSNVMRDIRNILEQLEEKHKFNFELMFKITKLGKNLKKTSVNFSVKGRNLC
ncbi:Rha family transcriptional regulator [Bacteroides fragilis]